MDVAALGSAVVNQSAAERSGSALADTFDTFLNLLTKQLQNQDPLDPVDSGEFTQQLVLFTSAEQAVATNKNLETLIKLSTSNQSAAAVGYIGKTVEAEGRTSTLSQGLAVWQFELPSNAEQVDITVTDSNGKAVLNTNGAIDAGVHSFVWDGRNNDGMTMPDGNYTISISAKSANGEAITASTSILGRVSGIETVDGAIVLNVGSTKIPFDKVISVRETAAPTASPETQS
ncbi:MAG: flagellar hook assembly protein FlgD [Alphaproteobacteria bacterium]